MAELDDDNDYLKRLHLVLLASLQAYPQGDPTCKSWPSLPMDNNTFATMAGAFAAVVTAQSQMRMEERQRSLDTSPTSHSEKLRREGSSDNGLTRPM